MTDKRQSAGHPSNDNETRTARSERPVRVWNNTLYMHIADIPTGETTPLEDGREVPVTKVLRFPSGRRNPKGTGGIIPGEVTIAEWEWEALKRHPSAKYMLKGGRGERPTLELAIED